MREINVVTSPVRGGRGLRVRGGRGLRQPSGLSPLTGLSNWAHRVVPALTGGATFWRPWRGFVWEYYCTSVKCHKYLKRLVLSDSQMFLPG